jgi:predicted nucleic acid binding AN1-type Zn finger protein
MRLEGATAEEWKPEAEAARQHFRLLAETTKEAPKEGESNAFERSVEATIRLEQMDLSELRAKSLPKNCPNCKNGLCQKKRKQSLSRCNSAGNKQQQGKQEEKKDARQAVKQSNGAGLHSGARVGS